MRLVHALYGVMGLLLLLPACGNGNNADEASAPPGEPPTQVSPGEPPTQPPPGPRPPEALLGQWSAVSPAPIVQLHLHLLVSGKVLSWGAVGDPYTWDPATGAFTAMPSA